MSTISYELRGNLYLNITNKCTNRCEFCIRYKNEKFHESWDLWLTKEPSTEEIITEIGDPNRFQEIVFCGYGEPLIRLKTVKEVCRYIKEKNKDKLIRIDTNGQANLYHGYNILPELKGLVNIISVSFNAENSEKYQKICHSNFSAKAYEAILDFIKKAKEEIPQVIASVVDLPQVDTKACQEIAKKLGVEFRVRPYYEKKYVK